MSDPVGSSARSRSHPPWSGVLGLVRLFDALLLGRRRYFVLLALLIVVGSGLDALGLLMLLPLVARLDANPDTTDDSFIEGLLPESLSGVALVVLAVYLCKNAVSALRVLAVHQFVFDRWNRWVWRIIRRLLYEGGVLPVETKTGELTATTLHESYQSAYALLSALSVIASLATFLAIYVVLWMTSWPTTLALTVLFGASLLVLRPMTRYSQRLGSQQVKALEKATSYLMESAQARREIQGFGVESFFEDRLREPLGRLRRGYVFVTSIGQLTYPLLETLLVASFCGGIVLIQSLSPSGLEGWLPVFALFGAAAFRLFPMTSAMGQQWVHVTSRQLSARRVLDAIGAEVDIDHELEPVAWNRSIRLDGVDYGYPSRADAGVRSVSFELRPGERIGVAGASGAGKSTLVSLIMGFIAPRSGGVYFDDHRLEKNVARVWRRGIGFVSQESRIFDLSIGENVALGRWPVDSNEVRAACEAVGLSDLIDSLPKGLATEVGEAGLSLSGGQRQRISLARAILAKPSLLILDEAFSALDGESARSVMAGIKHYLPDAAWIMVAHRLMMLKDFDRILVFRDGRICQEGSFAELESGPGYLKDLLSSERRATESTRTGA